MITGEGVDRGRNGDGPTLEAQYVLKDVVLIAAGLVVGAQALGARLVAP